MAGQVAETFVQCRVALEFAAYAAHITTEPDVGPLWWSRHDSPEALERQKAAFSHRRVLSSVRKRNRHAADRFEKFYQDSIDFGAHPNERSVVGNLAIADAPGGKHVQAIMLHGDGLSLDYGMKFTAQCAMSALEMLEITQGPRFELLGVSEDMLRLRVGL